MIGRADRRLDRTLAAALILVGLASGFALLAPALRGLPVGRWLGAIPARVAALGPWGPLAYAVGGALAVALMVPASVVILVAGAAFGPVVGAISATVALNLGSTASFLGARSIARDFLARRLRGHPRLAVVRRAIDDGGWKLVVLLRLSPLVPFGLQNYAHGLTTIRFRTFALAGSLAMVPATVLYALIGDLTRAGLAGGGSGRARSPLEWLALAVGIAATAAVLAHASRVARRAIAGTPPPAEIDAGS